ncbi:MAG TPA: hypothetical protein VMU22_02740 [Rhizomicrobium sp.]|nr:hypothetical protein [Rhizomicrobium sp.]
MTNFPFSDLHSFKDYVVYVQTYLPDRFPPRAAVGPEDQWTLDLAFVGLRLGLDRAVQETGERKEFAESRRLVEEAYDAYRSGDIRSGFMKLEQVQKLLQKVPSQ